MAILNMRWGNKADIGSNVAGQMSFTKDEGKLYIDTSSDNRIAVNAEKAEVLGTLSNGIWTLKAVGGATTPVYFIDGVPTAVTGIAASLLPRATTSAYGAVKSKTTGTTSGRDYYVEVLSDGTMKVNVPWTDTNTNTTYDIATASTAGLVKPASVVAVSSPQSITTTGDRYYQITMDTSGKLYVNVPWTDTNTVYTHPSAPSAAGTGGTAAAAIKVGRDATGHVVLGGTLTASDISGLNDAIDSRLSVTDAMVFKGTIGSSGATVSALPSTHNAGWTYKVITAGTYAGMVCEVGDLIICVKDGTAAANADWTSVQTNDSGLVVGPASATTNTVAVFDGATGKLIKSSGYTIGASVPSGAKFTDTTYSVATASTAGLVKPYSVIDTPSIVNTVSTTSDRYYYVSMDSNGAMYVNVPWVNSTYTIPTALKNPNALTLKGTSGGATIETITYDGSAAGSLELIAGSNVSITKTAAGRWTISSSYTNTTYTGDRGISLVSGKFGHSNTAITAQTTAGLYKVAYDAYGHITSTTAIAKADITALGIPGSNTTYGIANDSTLGLVKPKSVLSTAPDTNGVSSTAGKYYYVEMDTNGIMYVNVPWSNSTYTSLPNPNAINFTDGTNSVSYTGSAAKTITFGGMLCMDTNGNVDLEWGEFA